MLNKRFKCVDMKTKKYIDKSNNIYDYDLTIDDNIIKAYRMSRLLRTNPIFPVNKSNLSCMIVINPTENSIAPIILLEQLI